LDETCAFCPLFVPPFSRNARETDRLSYN
jgi:hypothetical protein